MHEKDTITIVRCELKIQSLRITVRQHEASEVILLKGFSVCTSQPLKILIISHHFRCVGLSPTQTSDLVIVISVDILKYCGLGPAQEQC